MNGFQVAPAEVEAVLHGHPAVVDCAVFGVADERAGEVPVAAVQLDPDQPVADGELERLVADSLATYKHLRRVVEVDAIPRLPSGKVLRRTLRDEWAPTLPRLKPATRSRLMDVRLSPEQVALRDSAAQVVDRLGPARGRRARRRRAGRQARRRRRRRRLARAAHRHRRRRPVGVGCRGRPRRRGAGPRPRRRPVPRADPGGRAAAPGRRAGGRRRPRPWRWHPTWRHSPAAPRGRPAGGCVAVDARGATSALLLVPAAGGHTLGQVPLPAGGAVRRSRPHPGHGGPRPDGGGRRRSRPGPAPHRRGRGALDRPRAGPDRRRPRRHHARGRGPRRRLRQGAPAVRQGDRLVPGRPAPAGRRLRRHGGGAQRRPPRRLGGRRPAGRRGRRRRRRWPRPTAPGPPARCARPPSRCTAASATPGSAWPTCTCGGRCCRATSSGAPGPTWPASSTTTASHSSEAARGLR